MTDETNCKTRIALARQGFDMRLAGHSYQEIAEALGLSVELASKIVEDEIALRVEISPNAMINRQLARYQAALEAIRPKTEAGNLKAIELTATMMKQLEWLRGMYDGEKM